MFNCQSVQHSIEFTNIDQRTHSFHFKTTNTSAALFPISQQTCSSVCKCRTCLQLINGAESTGATLYEQMEASLNGPSISMLFLRFTSELLQAL